MKHLIVLLSLCTAISFVTAAPSPNILFIIADDASRHFGESYDCDWVNTPNIDRLAKEGLVFDNYPTVKPPAKYQSSIKNTKSPVTSTQSSHLNGRDRST